MSRKPFVSASINIGLEATVLYDDHKINWCGFSLPEIEKKFRSSGRPIQKQLKLGTLYLHESRKVCRLVDGTSRLWQNAQWKPRYEWEVADWGKSRA